MVTVAQQLAKTKAYQARVTAKKLAKGELPSTRSGRLAYEELTNTQIKPLKAGSDYQGQILGDDARYTISGAGPVADTTTPSADATPTTTPSTKTIGGGLTSPVATSDPYTSGLKSLKSQLDSYQKSMSELIDKQRQAAISKIENQYNQQQQTLQQAQTKETGQMSTGLARIGGYLGGSASEMGVMGGLETAHRTEMNQLQENRTTAIEQATAAYDAQDFELAQQQLEYAKELEQTAYDRQRQYRQDSIDLSEVLAPAIVSAWNSDDPEANQALIDATAYEYGIDAGVLMGQVQRYKTSQKADTVSVGDKLYERNPETGKYEVVIDGSTTGLTAEDKEKAILDYAKDNNMSYSDAQAELFGGGGTPETAVKPDGAKGGQCGDYIHSIMDGEPQFGDTWEAKRDAMNTPVEDFQSDPQVGDILAFKTLLPAGHIAVVVGVNGNKLTINDSNYSKNNDETVRTRTIDVSDPTILGAFRGATFKGNTTTAKGKDGTPAEIAKTLMNPNSGLTLKDIPQKTRVKVEEELLKLKETAMKSGDVYGMMASSAGGTALGDTAITKLEKTEVALGELEKLMESVEANRTDLLNPLVKILKQNNPYQKNAQLIEKQLQAITPNLARGVFGEVGVLTDNDIKNYRKTLPTLGDTKSVQKATLQMLLNVLKTSIDATVKTNSRLGRDMSGFASIYKEIEDQMSRLGGTSGQTNDPLDSIGKDPVTNTLNNALTSRGW